MNDQNTECVCINVHGTFASDATWIEENSSFSQKIKNIASAEVVPFRWSGGNSKKDRYAAAKKLEELIAELHKSYGRNIYLVGHSHGGNVIRYALAGRIKVSVKGCFFLGTPFINFRARNVLLFRKIFGFLCNIILWLLLLNICTFVISLGAKAQTGAQISAEDLQAMTNELKTTTNILASVFKFAILCIGACFAIGMKTILHFSPRMRRIQKFVTSEMIPNKGCRATDYIFFDLRDEAAALLRIVDIFSNFLVTITLHLERVAGVCLKNNKWLCRALLLLFIPSIVGALTDTKILIYPFIFVFLFWSLLTLTMLCIAIVVPITVIFWILFGLALRSTPVAYGWEGLMTYLLFAITSNRSPAEREAFDTVYISCNLKKTSRFGLRHSEYYNSVEIAEFIASRICGVPTMKYDDISVTVAPSTKVIRKRIPSAISILTVPAYLYGIASIAFLTLSLIAVFLAHSGGVSANNQSNLTHPSSTPR